VRGNLPCALPQFDGTGSSEVGLGAVGILMARKVQLLMVHQGSGGSLKSF